ncbi:integrase, catalytic region, zinc finger, CCHC-type containing protein [Tanacetum coccineum]
MPRLICFRSLENSLLETESQWNHITLGSHVVQQTEIQCFNCKEFGHFAKECRKPKRTKDYSYHKEKMLLCKQAEKDVPLQAEQANWLEDTNEEIDEQELEAHYGFMEKIHEVLPLESNYDDKPLEKVQYDDNYNVFANERQHSEQLESINDTYVEEKVDSNVIPDSPDKCDNVNQADQNAEECDDERCKSTLEETISSRDKCLIALQVNEIELEKYKTYLNRPIENDKLELECKLKETLGLLAQKEHEIKEGLKTKAYEIFVVKEKHDELVKQSLLTKSSYEGIVKDKSKVIQDLKLKEGNDIDKMIVMEK